MPFTFDGTSLPVEAQLSPERLAEELKKLQQQQAKQQQQAPSPQKEAGASQPQPQAAKPQQQGPPTPGGMNGLQKWVEENVAIPATDFVDNVFKGDQQTPDEIARQRAEQRIDYQRQQLETQRNFDSQPGAMFFGEGVRAIAGGAEDLAEGAVNLGPQTSNFAFGTDFKPVNFGLVRENSTTVGQGMRTLSRYVMSGLGVGAVTRGGIGAGLTGGLGFAARGAQGFIEDFIASDGTAEDGTLIGNTEFTKFLQTNDANDPMVNRALVGLEGALFEAVGAPAVKALWKLTGKPRSAIKQFGEYTGQSFVGAIRNLDEVSKSWSKGAKKKKLDQMILNVEKNLGISIDKVASTGDPIQDLLAETRRMLTDPQVLRDQRKTRLVAEYHRAAREIAAPRLAKEAQGRLKKLLADTFAADNFGSTLDYTRATERDLALRLIQEDPSRMKLNQLIAEAAETVDDTDPVLQYLKARTEAYEASKYLDDEIGRAHV